MKRTLKNQKGFSLIELLIVIAIMGVLAVIAFNMFSGVLGNTKKRADEQQANVIERAFLAYLVDSQDWMLTKTWYEDESGAIVKLSNTTGNWKDVVVALQTKLQDKDGTSGTPDHEYGPYLSPPEGKTPDYTNFEPQWKTGNGGEYEGYEITIYQKNQQVKVVPTRNGSANITLKP